METQLNQMIDWLTQPIEIPRIMLIVLVLWVLRDFVQHTATRYLERW
jgi:hypothetical protein